MGLKDALSSASVYAALLLTVKADISEVCKNVIKAGRSPDDVRVKGIRGRLSEVNTRRSIRSHRGGSSSAQQGRALQRCAAAARLKERRMKRKRRGSRRVVILFG